MIYPRGLPLGRVLLAILFAALAYHPQQTKAHESRPAYLQINETASDHYDVIWRTPLLSGMRLPVVLKLPDEARAIGQPVVQELTD